MKYLGLDLALANTGYCRFANPREILDYGVITTGADLSLLGRIACLCDRLVKLLLFEDDSTQRVVVEQTDWLRGTKDSREKHIVETNARESLAWAIGAAYALLHERNIDPVILGPREWMKELGVKNKLEAMYYLAAQFPDRFEINLARTQRHLFDKRTGEMVPEHCSDAMAMTLVAMRRDAAPVYGPSPLQKAIEMMMADRSTYVDGVSPIVMDLRAHPF